jgi:hypothetical protein
MTPRELHDQAAADTPLSPAAVELLARQIERYEAVLALIALTSWDTAARTRACAVLNDHRGSFSHVRRSAPLPPCAHVLAHVALDEAYRLHG